jgi:hypothetical protein
MIAGIVFGVIGGIALVLVLFSLGRCLHSWRRTPGRDRIRTMMDRHYLEAEMAVREREDIERRVLQAAPALRRPRRAPPPPYQHAPAYESIVEEGPPTPALPTDPLPDPHPAVS